MKKISLLLGAALIALVMVSCGSGKQVASNRPCPECKANADVFRYLGEHVATGDRQIQQARKMAANNARTELAAMVSATVKRVIENYTGEYIAGENSDFNSRLQDLSYTVINQLLVGTPIICEDQVAGSKEGNIICYACVELSGKSVLDGIASQVSKDEKLRTDFNIEKFSKIYEEEMSKMQ